MPEEGVRGVRVQLRGVQRLLAAVRFCARQFVRAVRRLRSYPQRNADCVLKNERTKHCSNQLYGGRKNIQVRARADSLSVRVFIFTCVSVLTIVCAYLNVLRYAAANVYNVSN